MNTISNEIRVDCKKIVQSGLEIYSFSMSSGILREIAYISKRDHVANPEGYQRSFSISRLQQIGKYIKKPRATFPNTIIISLNPGKARFEPSPEGNRGTLIIQKEQDVAWIIDGQHRLLGFQYSDGKEFDLLVAAYLGLSIADQALLFKIINSNQKGVNPSLIYDLIDLTKDAEYAYERSHEIVKALNIDTDSPWKDLIKMLGTGPGIISQASMITEIKSLLDDPIFKEYQANDQINILINYFNALKELFPNAWGSKDHILCKTLGFAASIIIMPKILIHCRIQNDFSKNKMKKILKGLQEAEIPTDQGNQKIDFSSSQLGVFGGKKGQKLLAKILEKKLPSLRPPK